MLTAAFFGARGDPGARARPGPRDPGARAWPGPAHAKNAAAGIVIHHPRPAPLQPPTRHQQITKITEKITNEITKITKKVTQNITIKLTKITKT